MKNVLSYFYILPISLLIVGRLSATSLYEIKGDAESGALYNSPLSNPDSHFLPFLEFY